MNSETQTPTPSFRVHSDQPSPHSVANRAKRLLWSAINASIFRWSPRPCGGFRRVLLRMFGAQLHSEAFVHNSVRIWAPWNLSMARGACLGPYVNCYNVDRVVLGEFVTVSQGAHLCAASHDITVPEFPLITGPIVLKTGVWIATEAFVGMGVTIEDNAVVAARAVVVKDVPKGMVCGGNPAKIIKARIDPGSA